MKRYLLAALLLPCTLSAQPEFKILQAEVNLAGIGIKTTFHPGTKTELDAGVGYGLSIVSKIHRAKYIRPSDAGRTGDLWLPELHYGPYIKLGILYKFIATHSSKPANVYTKLQYTGWLPAANLSGRDEPTLSYQNRLALKAGYRKVLNSRHTRSINFEAGVAAWANYNLSFFSAGPQLNINFINDLITSRK